MYPDISQGFNHKTVAFFSYKTACLHGDDGTKTRGPVSTGSLACLGNVMWQMWAVHCAVERLTFRNLRQVHTGA